MSGVYDAGPPTDGVYDLTANGALLYEAPNRTWDFGAFYPDGTLFLRYGAVPWTSGAWAPDVRGLGNPTTDVPSALFNPKTGAQIAAPGLDNGGADGGSLNMMMPAFSPDGTMVAFNHYDTGLGHTIAVMDFDRKTNTFSKLRDIATVPATIYAGWPTFTPDDLYVFFAGGTSDEYDSMSDNAPTVPEPTSNIYVAQVASKTVATANQLNGVSGGKAYLPFPDDPNLNFEPTILPVGAGGYYWVAFTSRRNYGNIVNGDPYTGTGGAPSPRKKLWVAAIDITAAGASTKATDTTHPAFYIDGQASPPATCGASGCSTRACRRGRRAAPATSAAPASAGRRPRATAPSSSPASHPRRGARRRTRNASRSRTAAAPRRATFASTASARSRRRREGEPSGTRGRPTPQDPSATFSGPELTPAHSSPAHARSEATT